MSTEPQKNLITSVSYLRTTSQLTSTATASFLLVGEKTLSIPKDELIRGDPSTTTPLFTQKSSGRPSQTRNTFSRSTYIKEPELTKEKKSSGIKTAFSGPISTIGRFILTILRPPLPPTPPQHLQLKTTIQPESKRYSRELKRQSPQQSRNFEPRPIHLVAQEPHRVTQRLQPDSCPYKQVRFLEQPSPPQPRNQQVRFLLHLCPKERHQQYLDLPPAPFRPPDQLLPHFQQHRLHLRDLIHLTHQQPRPWLNRTNLPILSGT